MSVETGKSAFIHSRRLEAYSYPSDCPFNISRAGKVKKILNSMGLLSGSSIIKAEPRAAERMELKKFHTARYLHTLKNASRGKWDLEALHMGIGTGDCPLFKGMYNYSVLACGATLTGAEMILSGEVTNAFNPSGGLHHAMPERASGFCYINDMAIACMKLAEKGKKVFSACGQDNGDGFTEVDV